MKLQSLRRDFETLLMTNDESIDDFLSRAMKIVSQMCTYREKISDETIVAKVLRSLTQMFDHVVAAIEEAKDLSILSVEELMGSLQAHESRINRSSDRNEEKALQVKETANNEDNERENIHLAGRSRGRGGFHSFNGGRDNKGRWRNDGQMQFNEQTENEEEEEKLFMACINTNPKKGTKSLFKELDETQKIKVELGNTKEMQVEEKGTVKVETNHDPMSYEETTEKEEWKKAMVEEVQSIEKIMVEEM
ncbi:uncharacterized protein LOC111467990 [Cucurbita maxima]|uniref:Uncharacterized protein LOC111467990 n=1 Tax=Cucurbita maxima TaxID=3661 RepID=A0A6J1HYD2_CUCMA|nr:uncharacterized protein LOC111467990 [Cucurbita maxima]